MLDFNVSPYFDDFDATKNFHKILYRPGYPVQARELTQMQDILQEQVRKFGDHIFKNGSMVIPGNVKHDLNVSAVRVTLTDPNYDVSAAETLNLYGATTGVTATIVKVTKVGADAVFYVKTSTNSISNPLVSNFANSENIQLGLAGGYVNIGTTIASGAVTPAALGFVNDGIYYVNGYFVNVPKQSVVLSSTSATPSVRVGLVVNETIVTESDDNSLLDPALGSSNENAPGAHRQKIELVLTKYETGETTDSTFIILFQLDAGDLIKLVDTSSYNELMKTIARRTYEESGNYTVHPYDFQLKEESPISAAMNLYVNRGIGFVGGYEINNVSNRLSATINKARTTKQVNNALVRTGFGNYFYASNIYNFPRTWSYIEFRDDTIVTPGTAVGNLIGFAKVRAVEKTSIANVYKVFIFDAEFSVGKTIADAASYVEFNSGTKGSGNILSVINAANMSGVIDTTNNLVTQGAVTRSVVPVYVDTVNRLIYAKKTAGAFTWLLNGDFAKQTTSLMTTSVVGISQIQEPSASVPIIDLPKAAIKDTADYIYYVNRQISVVLNGSGVGSYTLPAGETFYDVTKVVAWNAATGLVVAVTMTEGTNSLSIAGGPVSATVTIQTIVRKSTATHKSKTKTIGSLVVASAAATKRTKIALGYSNVYNITSIMEGANDIKSRYVLRTNQRDAAEGSSYVELVAGASLPAAGITINFEYLVNSSGDFSTVSSYTSMAVDDSFVAYIPTYTTTQGKVLRLEDVIDFRPTTKPKSFSVYANTIGTTAVTLSNGSSNGLLTAGDVIYGRGVSTTIASISAANDTDITLTATATGTITGGILITGYDPATFSFVVSGQQEPIAAVADFNLDYNYYIPRVDTVCLTSSGALEVFTGIPSETPDAPDVVENEYRMKLVDLAVPAYTFNVNDIEQRKYNRRRYTMADIFGLDTRLSAVEEITALNMLEADLTTMQIIDPSTGLNRFKSGFVVDNFKDHSVIDMTDATLAKIDYASGTMTCLQEVTAMNGIVIEGESSGYVLKDGLALLPYTEQVIVSQPMATRPQNINPFAVFKWRGTITMTPKSDFWVETRRLSDINISREIVTGNMWGVNVNNMAWNGGTFSTS